MRSAMTWASSCRVGQSTRSTLLSASAMRSRSAALGVIMPAARRLRRAQRLVDQPGAAGRYAERHDRGMASSGQSATSAGARPKRFSNRAMPCWGCRGSLFDRLPVFVARLAIEARQDDPAVGQGSDDGEKLGGRRNAAGRAGGDDGFRPGGWARSRAASAASSRLRRSAGSSAPSAASMPGQTSERISRKRTVFCQCSA